MKLQLPTFIGQKFTKSTTALAVIASICAPYAASACTSIFLPTTDGSGVYARTMEFAFELKSNALMIPRQFELSSIGADGKIGKKWKGKYAARRCALAWPRSAGPAGRRSAAGVGQPAQGGS